MNAASRGRSRDFGPVKERTMKRIRKSVDRWGDRLRIRLSGVDLSQISRYPVHHNLIFCFPDVLSLEA